MAGGSLSSLAGFPDQLPQSTLDTAQNGIQFADNVAKDGIDHMAGTGIKDPGPPFAGISTKIDPKTGEQTHDIRGAKDWFLQQAHSAIQLKDQLQAAYDQQIQQQQAKQQFLNEHPAIAQIGRLASLAASAYSDPRNRLAGIIKGAGAFGMDTFGQSPEQIGGNIAQLQAQKLGAQESVTGILEKGAALEEKSADRTAALAESQRKDRANERIRINQNAIDAAKVGGFDPGSYVRQAVSLGVDPQQAQADAAGINASQQKIAVLRQQEREAKTSEDLKKAKDAQTFETWKVKYQASNQIALEKMKIDLAAKKQDEAGLKVPPPVLDGIKNLSAAEKALDRVDTIINDPKLQKYMGPIAGRTVGAAAGYFNEDVSRAKTNLKLEVAQAIKATGAGARGFGPQERPFFESLASAFERSPDSNKGVIQAWRDFLRQNRSAVAETYKGVREKPEDFKAAFGKDSNLLGASDTKVLKFNPATGKVE